MERFFNQPWTRKHDDPRTSLFASVPQTDYPKTLADLIAMCRDRTPGTRLRAAGSHWALSEAAISDGTFVETHDPKDMLPAMDLTITDVGLAKCLHPEVINSMKSPTWPDRYGTLVHIESGKRIYQLYAELDQFDDCKTPASLGGFLNKLDPHAGDHFKGRWGFKTMGSAGGQTVVGAFNTGTHGGDFDRGPLADSVVALHLVAGNGNHYWIESIDYDYYPQLTVDDDLRNVYGTPNFPAEFHIVRDNEIFNAVLVSAGRFGIIYSVVLRAERQYSLWERRRLHLWQDIKTAISSTSAGNRDLFQDTLDFPGAQGQRFLQIAVCLTPHLNFLRNLAGVSKRWQIPENTAGRDKRVGDPVPGTNPLSYANAGTNYPFSPKAASPSLLERACSSGSFIKGLLALVLDELKHLVATNGAAVGAGVGAIAAGGGTGLITLLPALALLAIAVKELLDAFGADDRMGEAMEKIKAKLLDPNEPDPIKRAAGLFIWQMIAYKVFETLQGDMDQAALSYAVMDSHNYRDQGCEHNVASVEVFFDADDSRLIAFVDALIAFEIEQELQGKACLGYAALRFMGGTQATIGMQQWPRTCSIEVSGLKDVNGSEQMVEYAAKLALTSAMGGILHWGQYNPSTRQQNQQRFGAKLDSWRLVLQQFVPNRADDAFSSAFSRRAGLEP